MNYPRNSRKSPSVRKLDLLKIALKHARIYGLKRVTLSGIANEAKINSHSLVSYHFGRVGQLQDEIIKYALEQRDFNVIMQGKIAGHPLVKDLTPEMKKALIESIEAWL